MKLKRVGKMGSGEHRGKRRVKENQKRKEGECATRRVSPAFALLPPPEAGRSLQAPRSGWARRLVLHRPTETSAPFTRFAPPLFSRCLDDGAQPASPRAPAARRIPRDPAGPEQRPVLPSAKSLLPPSSSRKGKRKAGTSKPALPLPAFLGGLKQKVPFCDSLERKEGGGSQELRVPKLSKLADRTHAARSASAGAPTLQTPSGIGVEGPACRVPAAVSTHSSCGRSLPEVPEEKGWLAVEGDQRKNFFFSHFAA